MARDTRRKYTALGMGYLVLANSTAVLVTVWLMRDPFDWLAGVSFSTASGALVLVAAGLGLLMTYLAVLLAFSVAALVLERLGVELTRPL